jgi:hypothetical protein
VSDEVGNTNETVADVSTIQPSQPAVDKSSVGYVLAKIDEQFDEDKVKSAATEHFNALAKKHKVDNYTVILLLDAEDSLSSWHTNRIYKAASSAKHERDILLIVHSLGGSIEAGYFIGKTGKRLAKSKFVAAIPRKAKSAATLLALGADEIHMGLLSELGPIDPQIGGFPAQGLKNAIEILSDMSCRHPGSAAMLAEYLNRKLDLRILGLFERINESAIQYAERLIADKPLPEPRTAKSLADHLVNHYKDHSFVIDHDEATQLLGTGIVKHGTTEYAFANEVYESFDLIKFMLNVMVGKDADLVGLLNGIRIFDKKKDA